MIRCLQTFGGGGNTVGLRSSIDSTHSIRMHVQPFASTNQLAFCSCVRFLLCKTLHNSTALSALLLPVQRSSQMPSSTTKSFSPRFHPTAYQLIAPSGQSLFLSKHRLMHHLCTRMFRRAATALFDRFHCDCKTHTFHSTAGTSHSLIPFHVPVLLASLR